MQRSHVLVSVSVHTCCRLLRWCGWWHSVLDACSMLCAKGLAVLWSSRQYSVTVLLQTPASRCMLWRWLCLFCKVCAALSSTRCTVWRALLLLLLLWPQALAQSTNGCVKAVPKRYAGAVASRQGWGCCSTPSADIGPGCCSNSISRAVCCKDRHAAAPADALHAVSCRVWGSRVYAGGAECLGGGLHPAGVVDGPCCSAYVQVLVVCIEPVGGRAHGSVVAVCSKSELLQVLVWAMHDLGACTCLCGTDNHMDVCILW